MFPNNNTAAKTLTTSKNGIPSIPRQERQAVKRAASEENLKLN